jgi:hypothetical protein
MKATFFSVFAAAGLVAAQNLDAIPSCAVRAHHYSPVVAFVPVMKEN